MISHLSINNKSITILSLFLLQPLLQSAPAMSEGYCVACYSPDAVYQCLIEGSKNTSSVDPRHQILCVKLIAKDGGHGKCSVERFTNEGCKGAVKYIDADTSTLKSTQDPSQIAGGEAPAGSQSETKAADGKDDQNSASSTEQANGQKPSEGPIEDLTKSTVQTTKQGLQAVSGAIKDVTVKTGEKIVSFATTLGHATKKTWKCVSSFFSAC